MACSRRPTLTIIPNLDDLIAFVSDEVTREYERACQRVNGARLADAVRMPFPDLSYPSTRRKAPCDWPIWSDSPRSEDAWSVIGTLGILKYPPGRDFLSQGVHAGPTRTVGTQA